MHVPTRVFPMKSKIKNEHNMIYCINKKTEPDSHLERIWYHIKRQEAQRTSNMEAISFFKKHI